MNRRHKFSFDKNVVKLHRDVAEGQGRARSIGPSFMICSSWYLSSCAASQIYFFTSYLLVIFMQNVFVIDKPTFIKLIEQKLFSTEKLSVPTTTRTAWI